MAKDPVCGMTENKAFSGRLFNLNIAGTAMFLSFTSVIGNTLRMRKVVR